MLRTILIWGLIGGAIVAVLMQLALIAIPEHNDASLVLGYATMLIALSTVVLGVKQYRDQVGGGVITFWRGLVIGLGIALLAAVIYAAA
ncbi:MAG: DUF4199 domain-containing protein [Caulobacteraceae bacterium]|nr:DUF4199 domain-containing protein [Caulobacteraceae bacterium]